MTAVEDSSSIKSSPSPEGKESELEQWIEYNRLVEVESSGEPREEFNLKRLCDEKPDIFGRKSDSTRRKVQKKWDLVKRREIQSYARLLDRKKVKRGAVTEILLKAAENDEAANVSDYSVEEQEQEEAVEAEEEAVEADVVSQVVSAFGDLSVSAHTSPPSTPPRLVTMSDLPSTASPVWSADSGGIGSGIGNGGNFVDGSGSGLKSNPIIIYVNKDYPERNREFHIQYVKAFEQGEYKRNGWVIRTGVCSQDRATWSAAIYSTSKVNLANRAVMVKGPSRPHWMHMDTEWTTKINCAATTSYARNTTNSINGNEDRQYKYWLLIFPEKTHLANEIISGDPFKVKKRMEGIMVVVKEKEHRYITMNWKIADKHGSLDLATADDESGDCVD